MRDRVPREVWPSLPAAGVEFPYFKDRYALQLLAYAAADGRPPFASLLQKPTIRRILAEARRTRGGWDLLDSYFPPTTELYHLTFALWGEETDETWYQTSRPGFNLVVQLNFPLAHDRAYRRCVRPDASDPPFEWDAHPIHQKGRHTLAWSRIDFDLARGEALIEEVQSDWVRYVRRVAERAQVSLREGHFAPPSWVGLGCDAQQLVRYAEHVLANHRRLWDEAVLAASLWLLREHLGIRRIFMHTLEGGCALKRMAGCPPPRSLYENLPRAFCFERVHGAPRFLQEHLEQSRSSRTLPMWRLQL